jgi:hypothetical protein
VAAVGMACTWRRNVEPENAVRGLGRTMFDRAVRY